MKIPQISLERSSLLGPLLGTLVSVVTFASVLLLGFVLAYWTWAWFAPRAASRMETAANPAGHGSSANGLFGTVARNQNAAAPTGLAIKLQGVMAAQSHKKGYAVVQLDGKQNLAVPEGEDIAPGIRLAEVHPDHVILERNGIRETLAWPAKAAAPATPIINKFAVPSMSDGALKRD